MQNPKSEILQFPRELVRKTEDQDNMEILLHKPYGDTEVCIDNDSCRDCTIVKVDSANKHVFHVTDQLGTKITDESLLHPISEQAICASRRGPGNWHALVEM
ncbi:hypothetical protein HAX54_011315 [Datura stramonium]|uniref:Uncharacterized protein n=1 Tax=Datura stramonium TaxID=4076 RepID=A0ABS8THQ1_DATST|nr:hypothetical protein [Datura stramonium]